MMIIFTFNIDPATSGLISKQIVTYQAYGSVMISSVTPETYNIRFDNDEKSSSYFVGDKMSD